MQVQPNAWEVVLQITGLIGSVATIILGVIAIWLALYFYRRSNDVYVALNTMLSRVEALQVAIKDGILELYSLENPKNPEFETTACKLNKQNPIVKKILGLKEFRI